MLASKQPYPPILIGLDFHSSFKPVWTGPMNPDIAPRRRRSARQRLGRFQAMPRLFAFTCGLILLTATGLGLAAPALPSNQVPPLGPESGNWLVCCASYTGPEAVDMANQCAMTAPSHTAKRQTATLARILTPPSTTWPVRRSARVWRLKEEKVVKPPKIPTKTNA